MKVLATTARSACFELENTRPFYADCGYPDMREKNEKVSRQGLYFMFTDKVTLENVKIEGQEGEEVILDGVGSIDNK